MSQKIVRFLIIILAILSYAYSQASQPQFTIKAESNKAFDEFCLIGTYNITNGNIADCLEHCLGNCSCQSFQIFQNTQCQLCSSNKEDNSSLLHEKKDCVYATFEIRHLTESFQKLNEQCPGMGCFKYNCCQQSGLCSTNKICKPFYNITQPWKRYTCECPDGYYGDNCEQPIRSCRGYSKGSRESGIYKVLDSKNSSYQVHCDFDSNRTWTLVQSYSFAKYNSSESRKKFKAPLVKDEPINENLPHWRDYRLSKKRMQSIQNDYVSHLRFTCNYEEHHDVKSLDYIVVSLQHDKGNNKKIIDVFRRQKLKQIVNGYGEIKKNSLKDCKIRLQQNNGTAALHINIKNDTESCKVYELPTGCRWGQLNYFGKYQPKDCLDKEHGCVKNDNSTTQLWFGN